MKYGYITRNQCLKNYISRLGAIAHSIHHNDGYELKAEYVDVDTRWGKSKDYKYSIDDSTRKKLLEDYKHLDY
jgi:hypothetical protein